MGKASRNFFRGPRLLVGCSASDNDSDSSDDDVCDIHRTEPTYCWYFILMQIAALFTCTIFRNDSKIVCCWNLSYRETIHLVVTEYYVVICILLHWSPEAETAFHSLKDALCTTPVLGYPQSGEKFIIDTDASNVGIGGVLYQVQDSPC
jgi:hypothetical protein